MLLISFLLNAQLIIVENRYAKHVMTKLNTLNAHFVDNILQFLSIKKFKIKFKNNKEIEWFL